MMNYSIFGKGADELRHASARTTLYLLLALASLTGGVLHAQAIATASDAGILQIGGMYSVANSGYDLDGVNAGIIKGGGAYATFDFRDHYGIEAEFRELNDSDPNIAIYERTYEIGPRYVRRYGRFAPYAKVMFGRGVLNFPPVSGEPNGPPAANLGYNLIAAGAGLDYQLLPAFNLRADFEYQRWLGFPSNGLTPSIFSVGIAYRFH